jgi:hypothetical protein
MKLDDATAMCETVDDELTMCTVRDRGDVERLAEFNAAIHGPELAPMTRSLLLDFPGMEPEDQVFIQNADGEVVSALCLIPWTWSCEGTPLPVGEMAIVGTSEPYRRRGLVRTQVNYFKRRLRARGCIFSHIQGIAHFYRQFGYQYALPLEGGYRLEFRHIPVTETNRFALRKATMRDLPILSSMYERAGQDLCYTTVRSDEVWEYLLTRTDETDGMYHDTWIAEEPAGEGAKTLGYMRIPRFHFGDELVINEAYASRHEVALWMLDRARASAQEGSKPAIRLNLPATSYLVRLAMVHEATALGTYAWQIHIPDDIALLQAMAPVLGQRLQDSHFSSWTGTLRVSFYTRALSLTFDQGELLKVHESSAGGECDVRMPYAAFTPLVTGHHSFEDLRFQYPDVHADGGWKLLVDTLFPKRDSFLYTTY